MPAALIPISPFLPLFEQDILLLTPNNRLRTKILQAFSLYQTSRQQLCWQPPRVLAIGEWLEAGYHQLCANGQLDYPASPVSSLVRLRLWQDIIRSDNRGAELLNPHRLAQDCDSAYRTLQRWQIDPGQLRDSHSIEAEMFSRWAESFRLRLHQQQLLTAEDLQLQVVAALQQGLLPGEPSLAIYGFDDLPPLLATTLQAASPHCETIVLPSLQTHLQRTALATVEDEIRAAARWSREQLAQHPGASIGIIVPELGQVREQVVRCFTETFEAHALLATTARYTLPFNISAGIPLGTTPLIHDTLQLLRLATPAMPTAALCSLLCSPFWGAEALTTGHLDQLANLLKKKSRESLKISTLRNYSEKVFNTESHPDGAWLTTALQQLAEDRRRHPRQASASAWSVFFVEQLERLGWPGPRRPDSNEFQQLRQWQQILEQFVQLDSLGAKLTLTEALEQLQLLCLTTPFQAQTPESPIQILGALEGAGLRFSYCWVMGLSHRRWPAPAQPNPLLPLDLQRQHGMPHADAERELQIASALLEHYRQAAPAVVFSSAGQDAEAELQPSPLIEAIPLTAVDTLIGPGDGSDLQSHIAQIRQSRQLEWVALASAPPVTAHEREQLRGGSSILKNQAICPFAAFAIHRLDARREAPPIPGLSPRDRGNILHNALAGIWQQLRDQSALLALDDTALEALIQQQVEAALQPLAASYADQLGPRYFAIESRRQSKLLRQWLERERERPPFAVVGCEIPLQTRFQGLPLTLRLDRLDRLSTGELIVIDYKTGTASIRSWEGEYPGEPQLPLYALCYSADVHALMFACINTRSVELCGLGDLGVAHAGIVKLADSQLALPDNWHDACAHWDRVLGQLTADFLSGEALAEFRHPGQKRFYSDLLPLLRSPEHTALRELFTRFQGLPPQ